MLNWNSNSKYFFKQLIRNNSKQYREPVSQQSHTAGIVKKIIF